MVNNGMYCYDSGCFLDYYSSRMRMSVRPLVDADDSNVDLDVVDDGVVVGIDVLVHDIHKMNHHYSGCHTNYCGFY